MSNEKILCPLAKSCGNCIDHKCQIGIEELKQPYHFRNLMNVCYYPYNDESAFFKRIKDADQDTANHVENRRKEIMKEAY
ncbi:MAG: hypothetical protein ACW990_00110 [Promethearchaeota archaeon]|jgi:hypothetical protein